jgi:hypothetical protein
VLSNFPGFARTNAHQPYATNWTDFAATGGAAKRVGHVPIAVEEIGLGKAFDIGFDRKTIGRRNLFRQSKNFDSSRDLDGEKTHFEDNDRVRGLVTTPSTGLFAEPESKFSTPAHGGWMAFKSSISIPTPNPIQTLT